MDDLTPFGLPLPASPDQAQLRLTNRDRQTLGCTTKAAAPLQESRSGGNWLTG
jgi:hypothetical protein